MDLDKSSNAYEIKISTPGTSDQRKSLLINTPGESLMVIDTTNTASTTDLINSDIANKKEIQPETRSAGVSKLYDDKQYNLLQHFDSLIAHKFDTFKCNMLAEIQTIMEKHCTETIKTVQLEQLNDTNYILNELDNNDEEKEKLQHEIETLRNELLSLKDENLILKKKLAHHEPKQTATSIINQVIRNDEIINNIVNNHDMINNALTINKDTKNKICIISSNKHNKIKQLAEKFFGNKYDVCHYLKPAACLDNLLKDIDKKLIGYTKRDCCYIMVGESDFLQTKDYVEMVTEIRRKLQLVTNTNLVLCLPTYKLGINYTLYNNRIENFNNLAYQDAIEHQHMYTFDTNFVISYDYTMFNKKYGNVGNSGMYTIFEELEEWMPYYIKMFNQQQQDRSETNEEEPFFRE